MNEQKEAQIVEIRKECARQLGALATVDRFESDGERLNVHWSYDLGYARRQRNRVNSWHDIATKVIAFVPLLVSDDYGLFAATLVAPVLGTIAETFAMPKTPDPTLDQIERLSAAALHEFGYVVERQPDGSTSIRY